MSYDLEIYAQGNAFSDGRYDLRVLDTLIGGYRTIFDQLVAIQLGSQRLSEKTKKQFNYDVEIKSGSLIVAINFAIENPEIMGVLGAAGVFGEDGARQHLANGIVNLYRASIQFRSFVADCIEAKVKPKTQLSNDHSPGGSNVSIDNSMVINIDNPTIIVAAQKTQRAIDGIVRKVNGVDMDNVRMSSLDEEFLVDKKHQKILGKDKKILSSNLQIVGRLDVVAFTSHSGTIVSDEARYPVTWEEKIRHEIQRYADTEGIMFTVNPVIDHSRLHTEPIAFHIIDCKPAQNTMNI